MGLLDWIIGWFLFHPNSDVARGAFLARVFFVLLRHILKKCHKLSKQVISGQDFLKNDDILSDLII